MHFQLEIQKCKLSKGDRSALQVGESKVHLKLEISKVFYIIWKSFRSVSRVSRSIYIYGISKNWNKA